MDENQTITRLAINDQVLRNRIEELLGKVGGFVIQEGGGRKRPELLILELGRDIEKEFGLIDSLLNSGSVKEVFLLSSSTEQDLLLRALRSGAKEFFPLPVNDIEVKQALERFKQRRRSAGISSEPAKAGKIITVVGSKGGVGATTLAVNLAVGLTKRKPQSVALMDLNSVFGDIPVFMALKSSHHLGEIASNIDRLDPAFLTDHMSKHSTGVHVLPSQSYLNGNRPITPEGIDALIDLMQRMYDVIVIDSGQSLGQANLRAIEASDHVLLVSLLSLPCLSNANKIIHSFRNVGFTGEERVKVVVNRYMKSSSLTLEDAERSAGLKVFWTIPNDYQTTMSAINSGRTLSQIASKAAVTKCIEDLGDRLTVKPQERSEKGGWSFFRKRKS